MILQYKVDQNDIIIKDFLILNGFPSSISRTSQISNTLYFVDNQEVFNYYRLKAGDVLTIFLSERGSPKNVTAVKEQFEILYEDSYFLIINKTANLATIPTRSHYNNSLANHVMEYYKEKGIASRIHFINRLDFATSGITLLAKKGYIQHLMLNSQIVKKYLVEVEGILQEDTGKIAYSISKKEGSKILREVNEFGQESLTEFRVLVRLKDTTLVEAKLMTGRTHQIRVHFSHLGHPVIGDKLYGNSTKDDILHLHSSYCELNHPITYETLKFRTFPHWWKYHYPQP